MLRDYSLVLLALIGNAEEISWHYADSQAVVNFEEANSILSREAKSYGVSAADVQELLDELEI